MCIRDSRIAAGIAGHVDVSRRVADIHRARWRASQLFNGGEQTRGVGLARKVLRAAFPMLHIHSVGETLVHDELHAAIELVRQHAQLATAPTQLGKQGGDCLLYTSRCV